MADLVATLTFGVQYFVIVLVFNFVFGTGVPFVEVAIIFIILASIGIVLWHRQDLRWGSLASRSVVLGVAFFAADFLIALLNGQANPLRFPGGLLALPLTLLICPGATMICLAGLVRAFYIRRVRKLGTNGVS